MQNVSAPRLAVGAGGAVPAGLPSGFSDPHVPAPAPVAPEAPKGAPIHMLCKWFMAHQEQKMKEMQEQREARRYMHGVQWTDSELKALDERKQPAITKNRIAKKINGIVGLVERLRQDPKAFPRNPGHEAGADLATAALRYACDNTHFAQLRTEVSFDVAVVGIGGIELSVEPTDENSYDVTHERIAPETFFYDPRSVKPTFSDARFRGIYKWMDLDAAIELMPDQEEALRAALDTSGGGESEGLKDWEKNWYDTRLQRVKIVEIWYRWRGTVWFAIHTGDKILVEGESPFKNDRNKAIDKYQVISCHIDQDGDRYGFIRNLKSPQDEINHRSSKLLHLINVRQVKARTGAVPDIETARRELNRPDGWVEYDGNADDLEIISPALQMQGQAELLQGAVDEIENFGPNPALLGSQGVGDASGRAIQLLQQAGIAELGPFIVRLRSWGLRCYRQTWNLLQQYWTTQRYIRISGNPKQVEFIAINAPHGVDEYGQPVIANAIGELDVDIILDEGPDTVTLQQDVLQQITALAGSGVAIPPQAIIEMSDLPPEKKEHLLHLMQPDPAMGQMQQFQMQAEMQKLQLQGQAQQMQAEQAAIQAQLEMRRFQFEEQKMIRDQEIAALQPPVDPMADLHLKAQSEAVKAQNEAEKRALDAEKLRFEMERCANDAALQREQMAYQADQAERERQLKVFLADIAHQAAAQSEQAKAAAAAAQPDKADTAAPTPALEALAERIEQQGSALEQLIALASAPTVIKRAPDGTVLGTQKQLPGSAG